MSKKLIAGCGTSLVLFILLTSFLSRILLKPTVKKERSETVASGDVDVKVVETGTIEPLSKVDIKSQVSGQILQLYAQAGARVQQGEVLARIDPKQINSQVDALQAQLAAARARQASALKNSTYQQSQTGTNITQFIQALAAARARLQSTRTQDLAQPKLNRQAIEISQANVNTARATLKAQQDNLNLLINSTHPNAVAAAQSAFDQARAQADNSKRSLDRQQKLMAKGFVSQQAVDAAQTDTQVALAHLQEVKERLGRIQRTNQIEEENARSQAASAEAQVRQAEASLSQAISNADLILKTRRDDLAASQAAYDQAAAQLKSAQSGRMQDMMRVDDATASAADAKQIENQLKEQRVNLSYTILTAPMNGIVTQRYVEKGDLITGSGSFNAGSPVYQVADLHTMLVKIDVNEVDIEKIKLGMPARITVDAAPDAEIHGHVTKVSPASGTSGTASGTTSSSTGTQSVIRFPVEVRIDNADRRLKPGMSAHCSIIVASKNKVLRLPNDCVKTSKSGATVAVITPSHDGGKSGETVTVTPVKIGLKGDTYTEILSGVSEGQRVRPSSYSGPTRQKIEMDNGN